MQELPQLVKPKRSLNIATGRLSKTKSLFETHITTKRTLRDVSVQTKNCSRKEDKKVSHLGLRIRYNRKTLFDNVNSYYKNNYSIETKRLRKLNASQVLLSKIIKQSELSNTENTKQLTCRIPINTEGQNSSNENCFQFKRIKKPKGLLGHAIRGKLTIRV